MEFRILTVIVSLCLVLCAGIVYMIVTSASENICNIDTELGWIQGKSLRTISENKTFCSYRGIPYAKAPVGNLRFRPPQPIDGWKPRILSAYNYGPSCYAYENPIEQSEDCLSVNVFVPNNLNPNETIPVIVFIYGGAFFKGHSTDVMYGPDFLVERDVIFVTFNYRVGTFGFLSLGTEKFSGNMGLKDQQLAMKWVYEHISAFGGDNQQITLMGHSAGGASVHYQMLNDESRKYFKRAILMSGTSLNYFALSQEDNHTDRMHELARLSGESEIDDIDLEQFLQKVSPEKIIEYTSKLEPFGRILETIWAPIVENNVPGAFLTELPEQIYAKKNINIETLFSSTNLEALIVGDVKNPRRIEAFNENFDLILPFHGFSKSKYPTEHAALLEEIKQFYFGDHAINNETLWNFMEMLSDINFSYHIDKTVKLQAQHSTENTYYFRFSVVSKLSKLKRKLLEYNVPGAGHGEDRCYVFSCKSLGLAYDDVFATKDSNEESAIAFKSIKRSVDIFTSFAKTGVPSVESMTNNVIDELQPVDVNHILFIDVTNQGPIRDIDPNKEAFAFWKSIEQKIKVAMGTVIDI